jgi:tetratricopeptide (TPR) repeat protein
VVVALACSLAACGGSPSSQSTPTSIASYQTLVASGLKLLSTGNTNAAEQLFQQAITRNPKDPVAYYDLGVVYQREGDTRDALLQYRKALTANPRYVPALFNQAIIIARSNAPLAIFLYQQIIRFQPDSPTAFLNLGLLENQSKGLHPQALRDLARAVQLDPSLRGNIPPPLLGELPAGSTTAG